MKEYWVNVYEGIPVYHCSKQPTRLASICIMNLVIYNHPVYRIHVKLKDEKR